MLRSIRLLFRKFTPVEIAVLDSVAAALPPEVSATCKQQIAAINKVQRYLGWTDISFYRIVNGKPNWNGVPLFREHDEFTLSRSTYRIGDRKFTTQIICVAGHIFSFVTRPSIKKHCFSTPIDIQTNILTDPAEDHAGQSRNHPKTFKDWHANGAAESNGWSALSSSETYAVHLADADYTVLAARGDEFLISRIDDDSGRIYYASAAGPARAVGQSFADAMLQT